jgi:hypothetical protein
MNPRNPRLIDRRAGAPIADKDHVIVDKLIRYDSLAEELSELTDLLELPRLELPRAKGARPRGSPISGVVHGPDSRTCRRDFTA